MIFSQPLIAKLFAEPLPYRKKIKWITLKRGRTTLSETETKKNNAPGDAYEKEFFKLIFSAKLDNS